jgi:hypothetical protein
MAQRQFKCAMSKCKKEPHVNYYGDYWVCEKHWVDHCKGKINLKKQFNIKETTIK